VIECVVCILFSSMFISLLLTVCSFCELKSYISVKCNVCWNSKRLNLLMHRRGGFMRYLEFNTVNTINNFSFINHQCETALQQMSANI